MNYIIYVLTLFDQAMIGVFLYSHFCRPKKGIYLPILTWVGIYTASYLTFEFMGESAPPAAVQNLLCILYQIPILFMFEGKLLKKLVMFVVEVGASGLSEIITMLILCILFRKSFSDIYVYQSDLIFISIGRIFVIDVILFVVFTLCLVARPKQIREQFLIRDVFLILGFDFIHMVYLCLYYTDPSSELSEINNIIQFGMQTLLILMMFHQFYSGRRVRRLEKAKQRLEAMQRNREREFDYYKAAEEKYTEVSMIRHDLVNHLTAVEALARQPESKADARELLDEIKRRTHAIKVPENMLGNGDEK